MASAIAIMASGICFIADAQSAEPKIATDIPN